jgi:ABC-2 type transport system ATP-binding protein
LAAKKKSEMLAVETNKLTKSYKGTEALKPLDLSIAEGEIFGLVGPDGAGKTTIIKLLAALIRPSTGRARIFGQDTAKNPEEARRHIGYMSQSFVLYPELTVAENLDFFADLYQVSGDDKQKRMRELMAFSRLGPFQDRLSGRLSGGMKQKLALSCALIHTPKLLLLDEPTTGVDPISRRELWKLLYEIWKQGVTIILATPYMDEAERCSRIAFLNKGRVLLCDKPESIKAQVGFKVYQLEVTELQKAYDLLAKSRIVNNSGLFGGHLHVHLEQPEKELAQIAALFKQNGIMTTSQKQIEPSIEDVFLSLM